MSQQVDEMLELKGCMFLTGETPADLIHTPEDMTDDDRAMTDTVESFLRNEVLPRVDEIDEQNFDLMVDLLHQAGELGVFMGDVPEKYGGLGLSLKNTAGIGERIGMVGAFGVAVGAHLGIGMYPVMLFGTEEQKQEWLPKLAAGEVMSAYALTEPGCGSDALSPKTKAVLSDDGDYYTLNGTKQFITNGGFAGLYTVFASIGDKMTGFLVTPDMEGFALGEEEHKLGIKGSSTRQLIFTDMKVPAGNKVGEIGAGAKFALGILNIGRTKLGLGLVGGSKYALEEAVKYGLQRVQFKHKIVEFGLIQDMLGQMSALIYAGESSTWRTAGFIGALMTAVHEGEMEPGKALVEVAVEAALEKVAQSEANAFIVDRALQIFGGYGYTTEYPIERGYRDSRIARIYEGTNEVCRLVGGGMPFRAAAKGQIPLMESMERARFRIQTGNMDFAVPDGPFADVYEQLAKIKTLYNYSANLIFRRFTGAFGKMMDEEEFIGHLSDIAMVTYVLESALLRTQKLLNKGEESDVLDALLRVYASYAADVACKAAWEIAGGALKSSQIEAVRGGLEAACSRSATNLMGLRRKIAAATIDREGAWPIW